MKFRINALNMVAWLALAGFSQPLLADDVDCPPNLGNVTIDGNVIVKGPCQLDGTRVIGNVHMYPGGSLVARNARIDGNIQAERSNFVDVANSRVDGSIQLDGLAGGASRIEVVVVGGNIQLKDNRVSIAVSRNTVGADVQAFSNTGGIDISGNDIDGNLQCKENRPAPTGGDNRVSGNREDQCANLQPASGGGSGGGSGGSGSISGDVNCPPNLGRVTVDGNVRVTAACRLDGTTVKGNVLLYSGGSLIAVDAYIDGNIQAERANYIDVAGTRVKGSIQLDGLVGMLSRVAASNVDGNIQLKDNRSRLEVLANSVNGDIQAFSNRGGVLITDNIVGGNLQCKSNSPAPTGGNNQVFGNKEDQCASLMAGAPMASSPAEAAAAGGVPAGAESSSGGGGGATGPLALLLLAGTGLLTRRQRSIAA